MRQDLTDIIVVLDRSGSMTSIMSDTIGGFNTFLESQKNLPGEATLTLVQFDHEINTVYKRIDIKGVENLTTQTFVPRGNTALLDAIGRTIVTMGNEYSNMVEDERPGHIVFVIITDGEENASKEYSNSQIKSMIETQTGTYSWDFVYLGANVDAFAEADNIGIAMDKAMNYKGTSQGTKDMYNAVAVSLSCVRSGHASHGMQFTQEDRDKQL